MITLNIQLDLAEETLQKLSEEEWNALRRLIGKLGGDLPTLKQIAKEKEARELVEYRWEVLGRRIEDCPLSTRAKTGLQYAGVVTLGRLVEMTGWDVRHIKNIGLKTYREIKDYLAALGLRLQIRRPTAGQAARGPTNWKPRADSRLIAESISRQRPSDTRGTPKNGGTQRVRLWTF